MSDEEPRSTHPMLAGYWNCKRCQAPELQYVLTQTGGICWKCLQNDPVVKRSHELEIEMKGVVAKVHNRRKSPRRYRHSANAKVRPLAISRALARLRDRHMEEFMLLLQEERIKLGWPPQLAAEENVLADAVWRIDQRLRYLRYITPEELDGSAPDPRPAP